MGDKRFLLQFSLKNITNLLMKILDFEFENNTFMCFGEFILHFGNLFTLKYEQTTFMKRD